MSDCYFVGVDVGTGSARAGVFDEAGTLRGAAKQAIATWYEPGDIVEQSSDDIWRAVATAVRGAVSDSGLPPAAIAGLGFAATCSLVVVDQRGRPLAVGPSEDPARNIIVWMDHRALDQARRINLTGESVLPLCRRRYFPRDGDAQASLAQGAPTDDLFRRRPVFRSA